MSTAAATTDVSADWTPLLASAQADLEALLKNAEPLCALRRQAVALLRASNHRAVVSTLALDDCLAFLKSLTQVEQLALEIARILDTS